MVSAGHFFLLAFLMTRREPHAMAGDAACSWVNLHTHVKYFWQSQLWDLEQGARKVWRREVMKLGEKPTLQAHMIIYMLPCKILDFQKTAPEVSLGCCGSDWRSRKIGQGKCFDARCWIVAETSWAFEVEWENGIDSETKIMRSQSIVKELIPLPVTSMTCRRVWTLTHPDSASGHQCPP